MLKMIDCPDLKTNKFVSFYTQINGSVFKFLFKWNEFCECCFLSIYDSDGNEINTGNALVNSSVIDNDNRVLPNLFFFHKDGLTVEPTLETFNNYGLAYEDTAE